MPPVGSSVAPPSLLCLTKQADAVRSSELGLNAGEVVRHGVRGNGQSPCDLAVCHSLAEAVEDFSLAWCQSVRSEEHTSELQSRRDLVCRLLLEKKKKKKI